MGRFFFYNTCSMFVVQIAIQNYCTKHIKMIPRQVLFCFVFSIFVYFFFIESRSAEGQSSISPSEDGHPTTAEGRLNK